MVEMLDAQGQYFSEVSRKIGVESRDEYRLVWFSNDKTRPLNSTAIPQVLKELAKYPQFDSRSYLVDNARDKTGRLKKVLVLPIDCNNVLPEDPVTDSEMPNPDETYLAIVNRRPSQNPLRFLVLSETIRSVESIALRRASVLVGYYPEVGSIDVLKITPEEFVDEAKKQIDRGIKQPQFILRFAGLQQYQLERIHNSTLS